MNGPGKALFIFAVLMFVLPVSTAFCFDSSAYRMGESIVVYGEYPVVEELGRGAFESKGGGTEAEKGSPLIDYEMGSGYREKALIEGFHFMSANIYGYRFTYKPGSVLMKREEEFTIELRGELGEESVNLIADGVYDTIYRVKLEFQLTPSTFKWLSAFTSNTLRLEEAEGTSDFYAGWKGRDAAYREALRNLVLITARKRFSSKPLVLEGDIMIKGNPEFSVGAGRYYCKLKGFVNIVKVITYD
ncbi:MAG: hypothetical protein ACUVWJ_05160 [Spirochaetota bacterium]